MKSKRADLQKSSIVKRSVVINGHKTSVSVEDLFWNTLKKMAIDARVSVSELIANIDGARKAGNLSSAIRTYVLAHHINNGGGHLLGRKPDGDGLDHAAAQFGVGAGSAALGNGHAPTIDSES
ncbi:MAG: hypothetical protein GC182_22235 [Rhodopseudomonas sp.]|nr:hypothetical protein [Rhodopseudomonas sp.]